MKAKFTRLDGTTGACRLELDKLTQGEALAIAHALEARFAAGSAVSEDLMIAFRHALREDSSFETQQDNDQQLYEALGGDGALA